MTLTEEHIGKTAFLRSKQFPYIIASKVMKKKDNGRIVTYARQWYLDVQYVLDGEDAIKEIERLKKLKADRRYDLQNTDEKHKLNLSLCH